MSWQFPWYAVALVFAASLSLVMAAIAWRRRATSGSLPFMLLMVSASVWSLSSALEAASTQTAYKVLWSKVQYLGISSVSLLWLIFVARYTRQDRWLTRTVMAWLTVIPIITIGMAMTNEWHGLLWPSITPAPGGGDFLIYGHGPVFWLILTFSYLCVLAATVVLIRAVARSPLIYRRQAMAMLASGMAPWLGNFIYVSGLSPVPGLDLTPLAFTFSGVIVVVTVFRFHLLDLVPVARHALVEDMPDAVIVFDAQNRIVDLNPAAWTLLGLPPDALGGNASRVFRAYPALLGLLDRGDAVQDELVLNGSRIMCLDVRLSPLRDRAGQYGGRLLLLRDVTERRRTEQALRETRSWAELVYNSASDAMFLMSVEPGDVFRCLSVNRSYLLTTGLTERQLIGKRPDEVLPEPAAGYVIGRYHEAIHLGRPITYEESVDMPAGYCVVETTLAPIFDPDGRCVNLLGASRDISQRKRTEEELRRAKAASETAAEAAEAANRAKSVFLSNISHEFRTPMNAVLGFAQLMAYDSDLSSAGREHVAQIMKSGAQLLKLIDRILDMSKDEAGKLTTHEQLFDLRALLAECQAAFDAQAAAKGLRLEWACSLRVPERVIGDHDRLRQVLARVLATALRLTQHGRVLLNADASADERDGRGCRLFFGVQCADSAVEPYELSRLFEPYEQTNGNAEVPASDGLGLATSRQYVRQMGGDLSACSDAQRGSRFEFDILVTAPTDRAGRVEPPAASDADAAGGMSESSHIPLSAADALDRLGALPTRWRDQLRRAVELGDFDEVAALAALLEPRDSELASMLKYLAYNYEQDRLLQLARPVQVPA